LATPVLITCARRKVAAIIHHLVETLVFLAPVGREAALLAITEAGAPEGSWAYDALSGGVVIPYLTHLLAEDRTLVLFDDEGIAAFRSSFPHSRPPAMKRL